MSYAFDEPTHPAALAGHVGWYGCKHCGAWAEVDESDPEEMTAGAIHEVRQ